MGLVLMAALIAGCVLGLGAAAGLGGIGIVMASRSAGGRARAWGCFAAVFLSVLLLCILAVQLFPYEAVRPGSDYDILAKNLFFQGLGYCASPGLAALLAGLATRWLTGSKTPSNCP